MHPSDKLVVQLYVHACAVFTVYLQCSNRSLLFQRAVFALRAVSNDGKDTCACELCMEYLFSSPVCANLHLSDTTSHVFPQKILHDLSRGFLLASLSLCAACC